MTMQITLEYATNGDLISYISSIDTRFEIAALVVECPLCQQVHIYYSDGQPFDALRNDYGLQTPACHRLWNIKEYRLIATSATMIR